jgi:hypothetical protein
MENSYGVPQKFYGSPYANFLWRNPMDIFMNFSARDFLRCVRAEAMEHQVNARVLDLTNLERVSKYLLSLMLYFGHRFILLQFSSLKLSIRIGLTILYGLVWNPKLVHP